MKQNGIISSRVQINNQSNTDISSRIMEFVISKAHHLEYPFDLQQKYRDQVQVQKISQIHKIKPKRCLSDWRRLYQKGEDQKIFAKRVMSNKLTASHNHWMTNDKKKDNSLTPQTPIRNYSQYYPTRTSLRIKQSEKHKQTTLLHFALVQNDIEDQIFHERRAQTAKVKQYYHKKYMNGSHYEKYPSNSFLQLNEQLVRNDQADEQLVRNDQGEDQLVRNGLGDEQLVRNGLGEDHINEYKRQQYLNEAEKQIIIAAKKKNIPIIPYNRVKIRVKSIINNTRFLGKQQKQQGEKKYVELQSGLRFYSRG